MSPADPGILYRTVGHYEYQNALNLLDELLRISTPAEIAVYDKIISSKDQFAIYTNLSRFAKEKPSSLSSVAQDRDYRRSGLAWTMALSRLELMAMISVYGNQQDLSQRVQPTPFEASAFKQLLIDGMRTHYWALVNDQNFNKIMAQSIVHADAETVAYARRLNLVNSFFQAAEQYVSGELTDLQRQELAVWQRQIAKLNTQLVKNIQYYLSQQSEQKSVDTSTHEFSYKTQLEHCARKCEASLKYYRSQGAAQ